MDGPGAFGILGGDFVSVRKADTNDSHDVVGEFWT
jgi:hypothetical protein